MQRSVSLMQLVPFINSLLDLKHNAVSVAFYLQKVPQFAFQISDDKITQIAKDILNLNISFCCLFILRSI